MNSRIERLRRNHQKLKVAVAKRAVFICDEALSVAIANKEAALARLSIQRQELQDMQQNVNMAREEFGAARVFGGAGDWTDEMGASSGSDSETELMDEDDVDERRIPSLHSTRRT